MRDLSELNINEGGEPVERPAPSSAAIDAFQTYFGVTLPEAYLELLRHTNGGGPERDSIESIGAAVNHFNHLDGDKTGPRSLWLATEEWRPILGNKAIPFAEDGGGTAFFLDLETSPPGVKLCLHDENYRVVKVAPSFEDFIDRLSIDPDMI